MKNIARRSLWVVGLWALGVLGTGGQGVWAGAWPQILGPERTGRAAPDERIRTNWDQHPPALLWKVPAGEGVAGVAVAQDRVILFHRIGSREIVEALDAQTGQRLWRREFPTQYTSSILPDSGPRCVPVIDQGRVYVYGADRGLRCMELKTGRVLWQHELRSWITPAEEGYFGAGSSPVIVQGRLLVNLGAGAQGAGIVAFDAKSGQVLWKSTAHRASYSSPVLAILGGVPQVVFLTRLHALGLDAATGRVLWQVPFGRRGPTVNAANPVILGSDRVFLTASYGIGAKLLRVQKNTAQVLWQRDGVLSSQYTTPIFYQGVLYGVHGREDVPTAQLRCIDPRQGKVLWSVPEFGKATLMLIHDVLLVQKTDGTVVLVRPDPMRYRLIAQAVLAQGRTLALPALSNGRLYIRDAHHLRCYQVGLRH